MDTRQFLAGALALLLAAGATGQAGCYTLYGYEDEYGIVHLHDSKASARHVLLYEGEERPRLGMEAIRRLIQERGGASDIREEGWIKEHVQAWKPRPGRRHVPPPPQVVEAVQEVARRQKLDPELLLAVIEIESGYQSRAVSPKGAQGLMQLMPETQQRYGLEDPFDDKANIEAGASYLRQLMKRFNNLSLALAAYNAGPEAVKRYQGIPPFAETREYVKLVLARYEILKAQ